MINNMLLTAVPLLLGHLFPCNAGEKPGQSKDVCSPALVDPSPIQHQWAEDGLEVRILKSSLGIKFIQSITFQVSTIAFSSCYTPSKVKGDTFWSKV